MDIIFMKVFFILFFAFLSLNSFALDPNKPVVRIEGGQVVESRPGGLPQRYNGAYPYHAASYRWEADGWRQARSITNITVVTNVIPNEIQQVASSYKNKMEELFGDGAATNTSITESFVAITLSLNTNITSDVGLRLKTWFDILNSYWNKGEVWTFPYDQSVYYYTNEVIQWIEN